MLLIDKLFHRNSKYYDHIISLGYNCEVSFQFFLEFHFVESSLFAWVNLSTIDVLINALQNVSSICSGEIINVKPMWKCVNTKIHFHGKAPMSFWFANPSNDDINKDKEELLSRVSHLKAKFLDIAKDGKRKLFIFKWLPEDNTFNRQKVDMLYSSLSKLADNFDLLIVVEKKLFEKIDLPLDNNHIFFRYVSFFTPEEAVTSKPYDRKGWKNIFSEFRPNFRLPKKKKFKFEDL